MNAKTPPCDCQRIDDFLESDQFGLDDTALIDHLEHCDTCRHYMQRQAAESECWSLVANLLRPTEFDHAGSAECSAATIGCKRVSQPIAIQNVLDSLVPSDDPDRMGRLGGYEVTGVVGVGGMGVVLKAVDASLDRVVAIKVMAAHLANNATARKRFSREAKAAAAVLHPNVIPIHSVSSDGTIPYLVMSYIRGGSLQKRLECEGPLPTIEILRIGSQIAAGLAAAHEQGLVHRDIKPENILLEEGVERVTLTDFGLARAVDDASVTREGTIAGTPQYMSPEQSRGESIDQKSDLFSLGSVLYALCTGRAPFRADTSYGVMRRISDSTPTPIRELNPEIPQWLSDVIEKLMSKQKTDRFESAGEVHKLLDACLSHVQQPTTVQLPSELLAKAKPRLSIRHFPSQRRRIAGILAILSLLTVIGLGLLHDGGDLNVTPNSNTTSAEVLGHGYSRNGDFIYFDGQRIDQAGNDDVEEFSKAVGYELTLCHDVDAASFKALSEQYTKDRDNVYYKWISPGRFWVIELPEADSQSFEVLGFNLAKDRDSVWWYGRVLPQVDASTVELVKDGFVWKDLDNVWYQHEKIADADPKTFRHLDQAYYRDANRVYWSNVPLVAADPSTFRTFGEDIPYGADRNHVWKATVKIIGVDAETFEVVHQSVYKDKNGVYAGGNLIDHADPATFRKVADLDQHFTALLADAQNNYIFLPFGGEVYRLEPTTDSLKVSRQIWPPHGTQSQSTEPQPFGPTSLATSTAELTDAGWVNQRVTPEVEHQESHVLKIYLPQFRKAWDILRDQDGRSKELRTTPP